MVKAPWNRNRTRPSAVNIPSEVEEYYQSSHKERRGIAWLLGLATLVLTLIIAAAIFFGVRFVFNKFFGNKTPESSQTTESATPETNQENNQGSDGPTSINQNQSTENNNNSNPQANNGTPQNNAQQNTSQQPSSQNSTTTPITGPETPEIPHTGPTSND